MWAATPRPASVEGLTLNSKKERPSESMFSRCAAARVARNFLAILGVGAAAREPSFAPRGFARRGGGCALKKIGPGGVRPAPTPLERTAFHSRNVEAKEEDRRRRRVGHELQARLHAQRWLVPIEGAQKEHARLRDRLEDVDEPRGQRRQLQLRAAHTLHRRARYHTHEAHDAIGSRALTIGGPCAQHQEHRLHARIVDRGRTLGGKCNGRCSRLTAHEAAAARLKVRANVSERPGGRRCGLLGTSGLPLILVPCAEPRSTTTTEPEALTVMAACSREMEPCVSTINATWKALTPWTSS